MREITRPWLFFFVLALFPFLMRTGLDLAAVKQQAFIALYQQWHWSPQGRALLPGQNLVFDSVDTHSHYEELLRSQLQKDYRLVNYGDFPHVRAYFSESTLLSGRIEWRGADSLEINVWNGETRICNNGILFGAWLALFLFIVGSPLWVCILSSLSSMLLWFELWSPLNVPGRVISFFINFKSEFLYRLIHHQWHFADVNRIPIITAIAWVLLLTFLWPILFRQRKATERSLVYYLISSIVFEGMALYVASKLGAWKDVNSWWKIFVGSFAYRFVTLGLLALSYVKPKLLLDNKQDGQMNVYRIHFLALLLPLVFVMTGGWEWLSAVLTSSPDAMLLRLKIFFIGVILSFVLGSRFFSIWLGALATAFVIPPTTGHWNAAVLYGFLMDGLLVGWCFTPLKGLDPVMPFHFRIRQSTTVIAIAWIVGIFLSSVDVPLVFCWVLLFLAYWIYTQISEGNERQTKRMIKSEGLA